MIQQSVVVIKLGTGYCNIKFHSLEPEAIKGLALEVIRYSTILGLSHIHLCDWHAFCFLVQFVLASISHETSTSYKFAIELNTNVF